MGRHLDVSQLRRLEEHKYSSSSVSLLDHLMQPWWCWLVECCPLTLAPNLITVTGLVVNILTTLILVVYSPDAKQDVPRWASLLCALGLFVYQSLDAIDGKQARRTGTSSPLGELFDHGCDSLSTVFVSLGVCCSVQLGHHPYWMFFQCLTAGILFYCAHWQTYVSGTLRFGYIDVTEAQFGVIIIHLVSAFCGSNFWQLKIPGTEHLFVYIYISIGVGQVLIAFWTQIPKILTDGAGKNGSTIAGTSVLSPVVPLFLIVAPAILIAWKSPYGLYLGSPALYLLTFGCVASRVTNRLVVAHMTKSEMCYTDASLFGPTLLIINLYLGCPINEHYLLWIVCGYVCYDLVKYCRQVCLEICLHLNINLFTIIPKIPGTSCIETNGSSSNKYNTRSKNKLK